MKSEIFREKSRRRRSHAERVRFLLRAYNEGEKKERCVRSVLSWRLMSHVIDAIDSGMTEQSAGGLLILMDPTTSGGEKTCLSLASPGQTSAILGRTGRMPSGPAVQLANQSEPTLCAAGLRNSPESKVARTQLD